MSLFGYSKGNLNFLNEKNITVTKIKCNKLIKTKTLCEQHAPVFRSLFSQMNFEAEHCKLKKA